MNGRRAAYLATAFMVWLSVLSGKTGAIPEYEKDCVSCHEEKTPGVVKYWKGSRHGARGIGCEACHGTDGKANHAGVSRPPVKADACSSCHKEAARSHFAGKHGSGFREGTSCTRNTPNASAQGCGDCHDAASGLPRTSVECARFLAQSKEMQRQGCTFCHKVEDRCDSCHTAHDTDLSIVRKPEICVTCHMGPDHEQYDMWKTSKHGILYEQKGGEYAPDCNRCHMPKGSHNVSLGISMGLAGQPYPEEIRIRERKNMVGICSECHAPGYAERNLADADAVQKQSKALVDEAEAIVSGLQAEGLVLPAPARRPPHPLSGKAFDIGPQMLYENLSRVEAELFRMKKFYYVSSYKGIFHQNPDHAHWLGNAPLKLGLSEIRSDAEHLLRLKRLESRAENLAGQILPGELPSGTESEEIRAQLRKLRDDYLKGGMTDSEYEQGKKTLLEKFGL